MVNDATKLQRHLKDDSGKHVSDSIRFNTINYMQVERMGG